MSTATSNRPPGTIDTRCVACGAAIFAVAGTAYPQCAKCLNHVDLEAHKIVEGWEYRGALVQIQRKEGPRCPYFRAVWDFDDGTPASAADSWTTSQTLAGQDARRAIDRRLDKTTDHCSLADRLAEEDRGDAMGTPIDLRPLLRKFRACSDATEWADDRDAEKAWNECERGEWLLWISARLKVDRKLIVAAACECARLALPHVKAGEQRPLVAIETAEKWTRGEATIAEVRAAAADAAYAYSAADAAYAYSADAAAADAAYAAADAAAYAAADAAYAADAAADAAYAYAAADDTNARTKTRKQCADIARRVIPYRVIAAKAREALK